MSFTWTDEALEQLKLRWTKGESAGEIARAIGNPSRNSVVGKAHRLGLARSAVAITETRAQAGTIAGVVARVAAVRAAAPRVIAGVAPAPARAEAVNVVRLFREQRSSAPERACELMALQFSSCRWPISPPETAPADTLFCGAPQRPGSSYCDHHHARAGGGERTPAQREAAARLFERGARRYAG